VAFTGVGKTLSRSDWYAESRIAFYLPLKSIVQFVKWPSFHAVCTTSRIFIITSLYNRWLGSHA
jgi:hypothetical protein